MHSGIDFAARYGSPIYAVTDGTVQFAGRHGGHGNYVRLSHGGGLGTGYGHMSRIAVSNGQRVSRGQVIGYVGSTGLSTGPHLHYEMYRNGATVNPSSTQFVVRAQLAGQELASFRARLAALQRIEPGAALATLAPDSSEQKEPVREIDRLAAKPVG
jgi:murein DD-endopeptidase MepM/ murein hydrolase activator NlpD